MVDLVPDKVLWQPQGLYQPGADFNVLLDRNFALEMLALNLTPETQENLRKLARETVQRFGFNYPDVLVFEGESAFVREFHIGDNGKWLDLEESVRCHGDKPVLYCSHNVDTPKQAYALLAMVDLWVYYSDILG